MVHIVTRAGWGAAFSINTAGRTVPPSARRFTVVHWPGGNVSGDEAGIVRAIERQHRNQGWTAAPGYNYLVGQSGRIFEGCGRDVRGAHSPPRNVDGWGICVMAPMNAPATQAALNSTRALRDWLCGVAGRQLAMSFHAEHHPTGCPGNQLTSWVRAGMPATGGTTTPPQPEDDDMTPDQDRILRDTFNRTDWNNTMLNDIQARLAVLEGINENTGETRRQGAVLLGALPPSGPERSIADQLADQA